MYLWTSYHIVHEAECTYWTSYHFVHEAKCIYELRITLCMKQNVFMNFVSFCAWSRMYLWTSYHFVHEAECIYELRIILCMKQNVFMNFVSFCAWSKMYLWTSYHFVHEAKCIYELRIILCMKQNVFMNFMPFLHLTDIISPYNINWLLFVMEIGVFSKTPPAFLNIIKPISTFQKIRPICILHCISLMIFHEQHEL